MCHTAKPRRLAVSYGGRPPRRPRRSLARQVVGQNKRRERLTILRDRDRRAVPALYVFPFVARVPLHAGTAQRGRQNQSEYRLAPLVPAYALFRAMVR